MSRMSLGGRHNRRWFSPQHDTPLAATGTEGRVVDISPDAPPRIEIKPKRRGLGLMFGQQLRLIK
jgi:hypothetical protein